MARIQSLVGELRPCKPRSVAKKKKSIQLLHKPERRTNVCQLSLPKHPPRLREGTRPLLISKGRRHIIYGQKVGNEHQKQVVKKASLLRAASVKKNQNKQTNNNNNNKGVRQGWPTVPSPPGPTPASHALPPHAAITYKSRPRCIQKGRVI